MVPGTRPVWFPLGLEAVLIFDETENREVTGPVFPVSPLPPAVELAPFAAEAQRVQLDGPELPVPFDFGWLYLDLDTSVAAAGANPPEDPTVAQAWVTVILNGDGPDKGPGTFRTGFHAVQPKTATKPNRPRTSSQCRLPLPPFERIG